MSTAGKVLTVLSLLAMAGWLVMLSAVTQLNVNWQQRIIQTQTSLDDAEKRATESKAQALDLTARTTAEQTSKDRDLRESQGRIAAADGRLSIKTEQLTRAQYQLADYRAAVDRAGVHLNNRKAEKAQTEQDLAAKRVEISRRQDENARLRVQLAKLQTDFKRVLAENIKRLDKRDDRPTSRPASNRRPAPSS